MANAFSHENETYQCEAIPNCPFVGKCLIERITILNENE